MCVHIVQVCVKFLKFKHLKVMKNIFRVSLIIISVLLTQISFSQKSSTDGEDGELNVYIPNAFTPNFDGYNDVFKPVINGPELEYYNLVIMDRNGKEVFQADEPTRVWNGTVKGSDYVSSPSIFVYFLKLRTVGGIENKTYSGHIVMIR